MSEDTGPKLARVTRDVLVEEIMSKPVVTVPGSASIREAARVMKTNSVGCVMVKLKSDLLGIVTERDLVRILANGRSDTSTVADVASKPLAVVGPKDSAKEAARILADRGIRRLPVVDGARVVGILTSTDLVRFYDRLSRYMMRGAGP
ncbi:MAG: CBS domain-containing protein [archaeon]